MGKKDKDVSLRVGDIVVENGGVLAFALASLGMLSLCSGV